MIKAWVPPRVSLLPHHQSGLSELLRAYPGSRLTPANQAILTRHLLETVTTDRSKAGTWGLSFGEQKIGCKADLWQRHTDLGIGNKANNSRLVSRRRLALGKRRNP